MDKVDLIEKFKADLVMRGLSNDTIKQYPLYIKALYKFANRDLLEVNEYILAEYLGHLQEKGLAKSSIKRHFNGLSTFYEFLIWEKYISTNPVLPVRKHYLGRYKNKNTAQRRKIISIDDARHLIDIILEPQPLALVVLLLKTGIRRKECCELDAASVDLEKMTLRIKPTGKRTGEIAYFDKETAYVLSEWLRRREKINKKNSPSLFLDRWGNRLAPNTLDRLFNKFAVASGLHDPNSDKLEDQFTPHCCRHWFSTVLLERGCQREYVQQLRGDVGKEAIDIYYHIDQNKLQQAYLDCIPQLGIADYSDQDLCRKMGISIVE